MITRQNAEALFDEQLIAGIIEGVTTQSKAMQLFRRLPNMTSNKTKMRVLDALPLAYWIDSKTNNGRKKLTKMAWDNKFIVAEELAVIVPIKEDVLDDASYDIWGEVKPRIEEAFAKKFDEAVFGGVDRPDGYRADLLTSIKSAGALVNGSGNLYSDINDAMVKVEESGYEVTRIVGSVGMKGKFRMMLDSTGQPIQGTEIGDLVKNAVTVNNGAWDNTKATMVVGDFSQAVYAIRQDITYKVLDQAVIQDPTTGEILYNLAQDDMVALRCVMRLGWEIPNPINALSPDEADRFPFAAIKGSVGITTNTVTFTVKDDDAETVNGAKVTFGGISKKTNASGVATFDVVAGDYDYTVKANGLKTYEGTATVAGANLPISVNLNK